MRILCLCTTYYQLITAIQIRRSLFCDDHFSVILTDCSNDAKAVSEKLENTGFFDSVYFATNIRHSTEEFTSFRHKVSRFTQYFIRGSYTSFLSGTYDLFLTYNVFWYSFILFTALQKLNPDIQVARYEEGIISYYVDEHRDDTPYFQKIWKIKRILRQPTIFSHIGTFYCFYPELYSGRLSTAKIPLIDINNQGIRELLIKIFSVCEEEISYPHKYIYFASMIDAELDGDKEGELNIIRKISSIVGKENLMIKMHPRENNRKRFNGLGSIDQYSNVPFEVIQLIHDFSHNVFITCLSGSVLNMVSMIKNTSGVIFTYKLLKNKNPTIDTISSMFDDVIKKLTCSDVGKNIIYIPENEDDIADCIRKDSI